MCHVDVDGTVHFFRGMSKLRPGYDWRAGQWMKRLPDSKALAAAGLDQVSV